MTKRILVVLALLVLPLVTSAQAADRDMLLTPGGTLYTLESVYSHEMRGIQASASQFLVLTVQNGDQPAITSVVPESLLPGSHISPALAYDSETDTLFAFWERGLNNRLSSDLVFSSYHDGQWSRATSIDSADWQRSRGLRIGVTRKTLLDDGSGRTIPELIVHAIWWTETGNFEAARYAMLTIVRGNVTEIVTRDLTSFLTNVTVNRNEVSAEVLRQPVLLESPGRDAVDVVFGSTQTNALHRVTIKPVLRVGPNHRVRIPIGVRDMALGAPSLRPEVNSRVEGHLTGDRIVLYVNGRNSTNYVMFANGWWTATRSIALNEKVSADAAAEVLRRMIAVD